MQTKSETKAKKQKINSKKLEKEYSDKLIQEVKESLEDYKKGKYVKGNVSDIMKAIRDCKDETD